MLRLEDGFFFKPKHVANLIKTVLAESFYSERIVCPTAAHLLNNMNEVLLTFGTCLFLYWLGMNSPDRYFVAL
jgi:hypothetical protein